MTTRTRIGAAVLTAALAAVGLAAGITTSHPAAQASGRAALAATAQEPERVNLTVVPDATLGSNKKTHDAFIPAYISARAGQQVIVTVYNMDTAPHSFTAPALGLNAIIPGAKSQGIVGVSTFTFTASKAGTYHWKCILPCDNGGANAWAMTHDGYMAGTITVTHA